MDKISLAQDLVPIVDALDERGLVKESSELDEIIIELMVEANQEIDMLKTAQAQYWGAPKIVNTPGQTEWVGTNPVIGQPAPTNRYNLHQQMQQAQNPGSGDWVQQPNIQTQWQNPQQQQNVANRLTQLKLMVSNIDKQLQQITGGNPNDPKWLSNPQVQQLRQQKLNAMREGGQLRTQYKLPQNRGGQDSTYADKYNLNIPRS